MHPRSRLIGLALLIALLAGCGRSDTPAGTAAGPIPTDPQPAATDPPPSPTAGQAALPADLWQPPEPKSSNGTFPSPTPETDTPVLKYDIIGLAQEDHLIVYSTREVTLHSSWLLVATTTLSLAEYDELIAAAAATPMDTFSGSYIEQDPDGVIREMAYRTVTVSQPREIAVEIRGGENVPAELLALEDRLSALADSVRATGSKPPRRLISYYLDVQMERQYGMNIDEVGNVFFGANLAGRLPAEELAALRAFFEGPAFADLEDWYTAPNEQRDIMTESRAIITYLPDGNDHLWVNALSGAEVPPALQSVLEQLADIYARYHP